MPCWCMKNINMVSFTALSKQHLLQGCRAPAVFSCHAHKQKTETKKPQTCAGPTSVDRGKRSVHIFHSYVSSFKRLARSANITYTLQPMRCCDLQGTAALPFWEERQHSGYFLSAPVGQQRQSTNQHRSG